MIHSIRWARQAFLLATLSMPGVGVSAGGGGQNLLLVINPNDENSLRIANAYQQLRDIPDQNIVFVDPLNFGKFDFYELQSESDLKTSLLDPIHQAITSRGLTSQIDYISTLGQPFRYAYTNPSTGSISKFSVDYGLMNLTQHQNNVPASQAFWSSPLYQDFNTYAQGGNTAISHNTVYANAHQGTTDGQYYMTGSLAFTGQFGGTADQAIASLTHTVSGDGARPEGRIYFEENDDVRSNTRESQWPGVQAALDARGIGWVEESDVPGATPLNRTDVRGAVIGSPSPTLPNGSTYLPGAWVDNLTSTGADFTSPNQIKLPEFIAAGAGATSGTVIEPFAIANRFPHAGVHVYSADGSTLGEAYHKSVRYPDLQMFVGDLLAQPYADQPDVSISVGPAEGASVSGAVQISALAAVTNPNLATDVAKLDLYVDGTLIQTVHASAGSFNLDTTGLSDGQHELRVVATNDAAAQSQGYLVRQIVVNNDGRSVLATSGNLNLAQNQSVAVAVNTLSGTGTLDRVELRHLGRTLVSNTTLGQLDASDLAFGDNHVIPVAIFTDGQEVAGEAFTVNRAPTMLQGQTPLEQNLRQVGVKTQYFLGQGDNTIATSDFTGQADITTIHTGLPTTSANAASGAVLATDQIDRLALRMDGMFEVEAGSEGEYQFGFYVTNDSIQLKIDGIEVVAYDGMESGTSIGAGALGHIFLGEGEHTYELLAANVNRRSDPSLEVFNLTAYVRDPDGLTQFIDGDGHTRDVNDSAFNLYQALPDDVIALLQQGIVFQADFNGDVGGTGGASDMVTLGGTGTLLANAAVATDHPFAPDSGGYLQLSTTGSVSQARLTPDTAGSSLDAMTSVVNGDRALHGGVDFFFRSSTDIDTTNEFRLLDVDNRSHGGLRILMMNVGDDGFRMEILSNAGGLLNGGENGTATNVLAAHGTFSMLADTVYHLALSFETDEQGNVTAKLWAVEGDGAIDLNLDTEIASVVFGIDESIVTAGLATGDFILGKNGTDSPTVQSIDRFRIFGQTPLAFSAIPEPATAIVFSLWGIGLLTRRKH